MMTSDPMSWEMYWVEDRCYRRPPTVWPSTSRNENGWRDHQQQMDEEPAAVDQYDDDLLDCQYTSANVDKADIETDTATGGRSSPPLPSTQHPPGFESQIGKAPEKNTTDYDEIVSVVRDPNNPKIWKAEVSIPSMFFARVIGKGGTTKKGLEADSNCRVVIPGHGQTGPIVVSSSSGPENVRQCVTRIGLIISSARERADYTHFLSIPLNSRTIKEAFVRFKQAVQNCDDIPDASKNEALFQYPSRLHFTIGMMALLDEIDRELTKSALVNCIETVIRPMLAGEKLRVRLRGIEYMNDDPSAVDVLYAKIVDSNGPSKLLQKVADSIADTLAQTGLMPRRKDTVKLHVTLMNTKFSRSKSSTQPNTIDIRKILENFRDFDFGEAVVEQVHVSQLHANISSSDYFPSTATVSL
uniref:K Homology domain-containing protein n=1 Tax=Plectus sambesii TaxID=2011161 RepID=A0A914UWG6_9BILA